MHKSTDLYRAAEALRSAADASHTLRAAMAENALPEGGRWVNAPCLNNCGGRCLVKAYVKDGVILRTKTDDFTPDDALNRQQRACLRGFSQQHQARGADRLKYPMKRKHWSPGSPNGRLRGQDEWERITWDEAAQYIADEIRRIDSTYGDNAILCKGAGEELLSKLNVNYLKTWNTSSWGAWYLSPVLGFSDGISLHDCNNDRIDMRSCEVVVAFGCNPAWSCLGNATNYALDWKAHGTKFILFDPIYTDTASVLDAQWVPIRPGTDMAAMLAMAYVLLTEDEDGSLIDWDFLDRCCVGFDSAHMPDDARDDESFFDYLLGVRDGVPKTPEWAQAICGVAADTLRGVARMLGRKNRAALLCGYAAARTYNAEQLPQLTIALGAMGGHIGKSGHSTGPASWNHTNNYGPRLIEPGDPGDTGKVRGGGRPSYVGECEVWDAVLGRPYNPTTLWRRVKDAGRNWPSVLSGFDLTKRPERVSARVKMIWNGRAALLSSKEGVKRGIEAHRSVEFVLAQGHFLTATNRYADIVLPITTDWERESSGYIWAGDYMRDALMISDKVVEPCFETKSDEEAYRLIGEKLGIPQESWGHVPAKQQLFNAVAGTRVICDDGKTWENLCAVTEEDVAAWGVEGKPQEGRIPIARYMEDGMYLVKRSEGDNLGFIDKQAFRKDPENNPISTRSGKIEFYCQAYADMINSHGYGDARYHGLPKYMGAKQGYEETFAGGDIGGEKGEYPLQCINPHYQRRAHSIFDNIPWLREALHNPVYLSGADARTRGIADGDAVMIASRHGKTLGRAYVTARMMPGVVGLPHGAWVSVDEKTGVDRGSSENYITGEVATGMGINGYNSLTVQVSKWDGEAPVSCNL